MSIAQTPKPAGEVRPRIFTSDFILLCLATSSYFAGYYMFLPTLPLYLTSLGIGKTEIGLVIASFTVSAALSRPIVGFLYDRGLSKWVTMFGAAGTMLIALGLNVVRSVPAFLGLRFLFGGSFASFTTSTSALAASIIPAARRGEAMGYFTMTNGLGISAGPLIGTVLMERYGFSGVSFGAAGIAAACLFLTMRFSTKEGKPTVGERPKMVYFSKHAFQPTVVAFTSSVAWGGIISFLPLFVFERQIGSAATFFTVYAVVQLSCRAVAGRTSDRYGRPIAIYVGTVTTAISMLLLAFAGSLTTLFASAVLYGLGVGLAQPAYMALAVDRAPEAERGQAMATVTLGFDVGITLGAVLLGLTLELGGFTVMFLCTAGAALAGTLGFGALQWVERRGSLAHRRTVGSSTGG